MTNCLAILGVAFIAAVSVASAKNVVPAVSVSRPTNGEGITTDASFDQVFSGKYCGFLLDAPATLSVYVPNSFSLDVNSSTNPCKMGGHYFWNFVAGEVAFEPCWSTCNEFLVFTNVTYSADQEVLLLLRGFAYGIGFTATLTANQCPARK